MRLALNEANAIIVAAFAEGARRSFKPLTCAVLDAGGHLVALQRQDGASTLRPELAIGKAAGALALGVNSRSIADMALERPSFVASLQAISPHGVIPAAGGVIILDTSGETVGAVGVTGDTSDNDEICALAGLGAAGLRGGA